MDFSSSFLCIHSTNLLWGSWGVVSKLSSEWTLLKG